MSDDRSDPFKRLSAEETRRATPGGGGVLRAIPLVALFDAFRGRRGHVPCPNCQEAHHPAARVCPHCNHPVDQGD